MSKPKIPFLLATGLVILSTTSCGNDKQEKTVSGSVADGTMHTLTVATPAGDTILFSTVNADMDSPNGILIGDSATVWYAGKLETVGTEHVADAVRGKVTPGHPLSRRLDGTWVEPVEGMPGQVQGFRLDGNGTASSVNMATLVYESWALGGADTLLLMGRSIGNGQTLPFTDTLGIVRLTADSLILSDRGRIRAYAREN